MTTKLISKIHIKNLFGQYTYTLPKNSTNDGFQDAAIIYGDNGVGKSTLLRIVFHLLSSAENRGHRTALYKYEFDYIFVHLTSGIILKATFNKQQKPKSLILTVEKDSKTIALWDYAPRISENRSFEESFLIDDHGLIQKILRTRGKIDKRKDSFAVIPQGEDFYLNALREYVPNIFILNAERRLDSDSIADPSDEVELRRFMQFEGPKRIYDLVVRSREIALSQAMGSASRWISKKAVIGTNKGTTNVHSVYLDVLQHILSPESTDIGDSTDKIQKLQQRLLMIEEKTNSHAKYELATQLAIGEFKKSLSIRVREKRDLAAQLLEPYITSLEGRLEAVDPIFQLIDKFTKTVNNFLNDKEIKFTLSQGFSIVNKIGAPLEYSQLSSGEQQLLLLFSYVLVARDQPSVFMIDEPEISLNIKWQRKLVQSLLDITKDSNIQFIFASHSIELLTQHRNRVVKLEDQKDE